MKRVLYISIPLILMSCGCGRQGSNPASPKKFEVGGEWPISTERLTNAWLLSISDPSVEWIFKEKDFSVECSGTPLPKELADVLLGVGVQASKVQGKWSFDEDKNQLELTDIKSGDKKGQAKAVLPMAPAGMLRTNFGTLQ